MMLKERLTAVKQVELLTACGSFNFHRYLINLTQVKQS